MVQPVIEAGDITTSGGGAATASPPIDYPAYNSGELCIQYYMGDDDIATDSLTPPSTGPNGEALDFTPVTGDVGGINGPSMGVIAWIGTATQSAGSHTWTRGNAEEWGGYTVKIPSGEHNGCGAVSAVAGTSTNSTDVATPAWTAGGSDGGGTIVVAMSSDNDPFTTAAPSGWTNLHQVDHGAVATCLGVRDAATTDSESIASVNFTLVDPDSNASLGVIVLPPAGAPSDIVILRRRIEE